ncbi:MAG TPA: hypothetical protein EYH07_16185 [Kiloniellaceae bacterium]|nr:hypothetical protein [Kiloniellaceae bacterium]
MTGNQLAQPGVIESEVGALAARLRSARQTLAKGSIVDLTPIEEDVRWLCSSIEALPREQTRDLRPRLMGLLEEINYLGENLRAGLGELAQLLGAASERRRALSAYASQKMNKP